MRCVLFIPSPLAHCPTVLCASLSLFVSVFPSLLSLSFTMRSSVSIASFFLLSVCCLSVLCSSPVVARPHHRSSSPQQRAPITYTPAALADQIHNLPGLAVTPNFNQFSGYLVVDAAKNRSIFYWYTESQSDPASDPLMVKKYIKKTTNQHTNINRHPLSIFILISFFFYVFVVPLF